MARFTLVIALHALPLLGCPTEPESPREGDDPGEWSYPASVVRAGSWEQITVWQLRSSRPSLD